MKEVTTLGWLEEPRSDAGVRFLEDDSTWRYTSYEDLAGRVAAMAEVLADQGLERRRLAVMGRSSEDFIVQHFGVLAAGGTCVPVPFLQPGENRDPHDHLVASILQAARPAGVLGTSDSDAVAGWPTVRVPTYPELSPPGRVRITASDLPAVIRFSSGTTGEAKGVRMGRARVEAGLDTVIRWTGLSRSDRWATWLPLWRGSYHWPLIAQCDLMVMTSAQFMQRPDQWVRCFGELGCTATGSPSFGYHHVATRVRPESLAGCRFEGWRMALIFGEPVRVEDLDEFVGLLGPFGFRRRAFCPTYGLTEAPGMIAATRPDEEPVAWVGARATSQRGGRDILAEAPHRARPEAQMVGAGKPLGEEWVSIRSPDGSEVPDGGLGEVWLNPMALADGHEPGEDFTDWYATGDVGGFQDGVLFIFGRLVDSFQIRGQRVLAEDAERIVREVVPDVGSVVVVPNRAAGAGITVLVEPVESWSPERIDQARQAISDRFKKTEVDVLVVAAGGIPRTPTGKPKRQQVWARYVAGRKEQPA